MHTSLVSPLLWRRALVRKVLYKILGFNGKTPSFRNCIPELGAAKKPIFLHWYLNCCIIEEIDNPNNCSLQSFAELTLSQPLSVWKDRANASPQMYFWPTYV